MSYKCLLRLDSSSPVDVVTNEEMFREGLVVTRNAIGVKEHASVF